MQKKFSTFLGDALNWLTGTATTKDIHSIKTQINQLIATQTSQCNTLVHIVSILNITRYTTQVNRHSINNLTDALYYLQMVSTHTMEYINAASSRTLSPHVLPITDLHKMLQHIADTLPPTLHLPILPEDTLHFFRYLHTHVLIENKQFFVID